MKEMFSVPMNKIQLETLSKFKDSIEKHEIELEDVNVCPFCNETSFDTLSETDRFGLGSAAKLCCNCGLIYTSPRIKQNFLPKFYDNFYHSLVYGKYEIKDHLFNEAQGKSILSFLSECIPKNQDITIAEIGCGAGDILKYLSLNLRIDAPYSLKLYGTEFSTKCIEKAKASGASIIRGDLDDLIKEGIKVDILILSHVFEHMIDLTAELKKMKSCLNEGGILYLEVPGVLTMLENFSYYQRKFSSLHVIAHMYNFTLTTLRNIVESNSFKLIKGSEKVAAVFKIQNNSKNLKPSFLSDYERIKFYLSNTLSAIGEDPAINWYMNSSYNNLSEFDKNIELFKLSHAETEKNNSELRKKLEMLTNSSIEREKSLEVVIKQNAAELVRLNKRIEELINSANKLEVDAAKWRRFRNNMFFSKVFKLRSILLRNFQKYN